MSWHLSRRLVMDYENSHYSRALEAGYSAANCWVGQPSALSKSTRMPEAYYWPDKTTGHSKLSRFGMTSELLTGGHGEALLTWFQADFPARTSALLVTAPESTESRADCGAKWHELSVKFDRATHSWKTHRCLWDEDLPESSLTLPRWGWMRDGELLERTTAAPPTSEKESGFWPTPNTISYRSDGELLQLGRMLDDESEYLAMTSRAANSKRQRFIPTPRANDGEKRGNFDDTNPRNGLAGFAKHWPTPRASDGSKGGPNSRDGSGSLHLSSAAYLADANGEPPQRSTESRAERHPWPAESSVGRVVAGLAHRVDRLRCLGNGQVPRVVAAAWRILSQ